MPQVRVQACKWCGFASGDHTVARNKARWRERQRVCAVPVYAVRAFRAATIWMMSRTALIRRFAMAIIVAIVSALVQISQNCQHLF